MIEREILEDAAAYNNELDSNTYEKSTADDVLEQGGVPLKEPQPVKPEKRSNKSHFNPSDPDAHMSYKPARLSNRTIWDRYAWIPPIT